MKKRLIALLLALVMMLLVIPSVSFASGDRDPAVSDPFDSPGVTTVSVPTTAVSSTTVTEVVKVGKVKGLKLYASNDNCTEIYKTPNYICVSWNKVESATHYQIYRTDGSSQIKYHKTVEKDADYESNNKYYFEEYIKPGKTYKYQVLACKKIGTKTYYGEFSSAKKIIILAKNMTKVNRTAQKTSITLKYKKVYGATRYLIKYSTKKSMKGAKTKTVKSLKTKIKNLKKNKKYYFEVKAYRVYDGVKHYTQTRKFSIKTKK